MQNADAKQRGKGSRKGASLPAHASDAWRNPWRDPASILSTASVPAGKRLAFWREVVCQTIAGVEAKALGPVRPYAGRIRRRPIPIVDRAGFDLLHVAADAQRINRTRELIGAQAEESWLLMIQDAGTCTIAQGAQQATLAAGDMAFLDTSRPYQVTFPQAFQQSILKLPATLFRAILPMRRDVAGLALSGSDALVAIARHNLLLLDHFAETIEPALLPAAAERAMDHLGLAMRARLDAGAMPRQGETSSLHFARARGHIADHLRDPDLGVERIARAIGLSSGHLHEVFRCAAGSTVADYVRGQRLAQCQRDLADPSLRHQSITSIAFRWGFSEASSFSRAFRAAFQTTPRRYRQAHRTDAPSSWLP